jgi:hypothetical protein
MKKFLLVVMVAILCLMATPVVTQCRVGHEQVVSFSQVTCPDCGCSCYYIRTNYCVGLRCQTVEIYKCGCCNKEWGVYQ